MTFQELRQLDWKEPGRWPRSVRLAVIGAFFLVIFVALSYLGVWQQQGPDLQSAELQEQRLREEFRDKHSKAVNLELYKQQLADIERSFGAMLRQLPGRTEVPNLLVDISQTGLAAGLQQQLFQPLPQQSSDFYAEMPIKIRLTGSYHQFGEFVSGIAALPRIVTLHDIQIKPTGKAGADQLQLDVTAKTYRYLDEAELQAADAERRKNDPRRRPAGGK